VNYQHSIPRSSVLESVGEEF